MIKVKSITSGAAGPEAVPRACVGKYDKRRGLFGVEGTQSLVVAPCLFQWHVRLDHFDDVQAVFDLVNDTHVQLAVNLYSDRSWLGTHKWYQAMRLRGMILNVGWCHPGQSGESETRVLHASARPRREYLAMLLFYHRTVRAAKDRLTSCVEAGVPEDQRPLAPERPASWVSGLCFGVLDPRRARVLSQLLSSFPRPRHSLRLAGRWVSCRPARP